MRIIETRFLFWLVSWPLNKNIIIIKSGLSNDNFLIEHEKVHIEQMKRLGFLGALKFHFLYYTSREFKLNSEAEAFAANLVMDTGYNGNIKVLNFKIGLYAKMLTHYGFNLDITVDEAKKEILKYVDKHQKENL